MQNFNELPLQSIAREEKINVCPDCKSKEIEYLNGEIFCKKCGLLLD